MARILHHNFSLAKTFVGTPYYMSPVSNSTLSNSILSSLCSFIQELLREQSYNEKSDLWSLGCLIYELCALAPPFLAPNQKVLAMRIQLGQYKRIPAQYSSQLQSAITSLIQVEVRIVHNLVPTCYQYSTLLQPSLRPDIAAILQRISPYALEFAEEEKPLSAGDLSRREARLEEKERALARKEFELQGKEKELVQREKLLAGETSLPYWV